MKPPGQLGDGDRNIPIAETSRRNMGNAVFRALATIRKSEGVDPDRYPPIKSDIEYDTRRTMIGAEITARETAELILPAIRSAKTIATPNSGGRSILIIFLIFIFGSATTTLAWLGYQEAYRANERRSIMFEQYHYLGRALMEHPKVTVDREGAEFIIHFDNTLNEDELFDAKIRLPNNIPPKEIERLYQEIERLNKK